MHWTIQIAQGEVAMVRGVVVGLKSSRVGDDETEKYPNSNDGSLCA